MTDGIPASSGGDIAAAKVTARPGELSGRVALVTGAGRGIGLAIARRLAADGASVVFCYRADGQGAREAARAAGNGAEAARLDVTDRVGVTEVVNGIAERFGRLDIAVNNAGIMRRAPFLQIPIEDWDAIISTNLTGYFAVSQAVARVMASHGGGAIVHVSSTNEELASTDCTAYAAAKGAVRMLTRQMALELGPLGIRTNAVAPGMVATDLNRAELADPAFRQGAMARVPIGRFATADDVADSVAFLVSDRARSVNGATLPVDGGKLAA